MNLLKHQNRWVQWAIKSPRKYLFSSGPKLCFVRDKLPMLGGLSYRMQCMQKVWVAIERNWALVQSANREEVAKTTEGLLLTEQHLKIFTKACNFMRNCSQLNRGRAHWFLAAWLCDRTMEAWSEEPSCLAFESSLSEGGIVWHKAEWIIIPKNNVESTAHWGITILCKIWVMRCYRCLQIGSIHAELIVRGMNVSDLWCGPQGNSSDRHIVPSVKWRRGWSCYVENLKIVLKCGLFVG